MYPSQSFPRQMYRWAIPRVGANVPDKKSRSRNRTEGEVDKAKGRATEATDAVTGDKSSKSEGRADQKKGEAKKKSGAAKDLRSVLR
jgi:uncharacterized protein YjbJ (UPF0337 family)